jgi:hypothetical protein
MKTKILILLVAVSAAFAVTRIAPINKSGDVVNPGQVHTARDAWEAIATTLAAGTDPTDLAADERTYLTVIAAIAANVSGDGKIETFLLTPDNRQGWNRVKFRMRGVDDNQQNVYQVYLGTLGGSPVADVTNCELAKVGQLAFTNGTQASVTSTYEMADTLTITPTTGWSGNWTTRSPTGELVAEARLELEESDVIVIVPTTVATNAVLVVTGY